MFLLFSCNTTSQPQKYVELLHRVDKNPVQWHVCHELSLSTHKEDCLLFAVSKNPPSIAQEICASMKNQQEECYFLLAEDSHDPKHCILSGSFQEDCRLHLLTHQLTERSDHETLLKELNIPKEDIKGWTVIYRKDLSQHLPLDLSWCSTQRYPDFCTKAAQGVYWDRLNRYFRCGHKHPKLATKHAPILETSYREREARCSSP